MANIAQVTIRLLNKLKQIKQPPYVYIKSRICGGVRFYSAAPQLQDNNPQHVGPVDLLNQKIANGDLFKDETQQKIAEQLQKVFEDIANYKREEDNLFSRLFSPKKDAPQGLYIHGAVGGGKTMLMDLFYECVEVTLL